MNIIAEVGSNWETLLDCITSVYKAKESGADYVKFQYYRNSCLYGGPVLKEKPNLLNHELPFEWVREIKEECDKVGIKLMLSVFSISGFNEIRKLDIVFKVASYECGKLDLIKMILDSSKVLVVSIRPELMSTIRQFFRKEIESGHLIPMYCVPVYPAIGTCYENIIYFRNFFDTNTVGFSDHSLDKFQSKESEYNVDHYFINQAEWIEKHVNFVTTPMFYSPDLMHSLDEKSFKQFVKNIRKNEQYYLIDEYIYAEEEYKVEMYTSKPFASKDIKEGQYIDRHCWEMKRPKEAIGREHIKFIHSDLDVVANRDILKGELLTPDMIR